MPGNLRVVIADDHPIFRKGLRQVIESNPSITIVGEAEDGTTALRAITTMSPDIAILDIDMPGKNGLEVIGDLHDASIEIPVIFLTMYDDEEMFNEAMDAGARGYVLKESAARDILDSIRLVAEGKYYISPAISSLLIDRDRKAKELRSSLPSLDELTATERNILRMIADGRTSKEIGLSLNVSPKTVDNHRVNIAAKLKIRGTHRLLKFAMQNRSRL